MTTETRKVALVTGAAKRIGRVLALALAQRGWDIVVHYDRSANEALATVREIETLGRRAAAVHCELADENAVKALLSNAAQAIGAAISCVVNNASLFDHDSAADFSVARLDAHMHANLAAPVLLAQALFNATPAGKQSVVVNLLGQELFNPNPDFLSYTLSAAALQAATTMLAQALAPKVRVVGVAPGIMLVSSNQTAEGFAQTHTRTPPGRSSTSDDLATAVCFVAESPAITGAILPVDGGQPPLPLQRDVMFIAQ